MLTASEAALSPHRRAAPSAPHVGIAKASAVPSDTGRSGERGLVVAEHQLHVLAALNIAAILVNHCGEICLLNEPARGLLGTDIIIRHRKLTTIDTACNGRLQALVGAAIKAERATVDLPPVVISRGDRRPLLVSALRLNEGVDFESRGFATLLLTDTGARPEPSYVVLREAFGLTVAEACLARLLAIGESLENAAATLGITKGTASQRLKAIFAKTETHRQGELICLLSSLT